MKLATSLLPGRWGLGPEGSSSASTEMTPALAEIEASLHLPLVDQIAVCSAGVDAQRMLDAPTHGIAAFSDMVKIRNLIGDHAEEDSLRYAGYRRSQELLRLHRAKVECLAPALVERTELDEAAISQILTRDGHAAM